MLVSLYNPRGADGVKLTTIPAKREAKASTTELAPRKTAYRVNALKRDPGIGGLLQKLGGSCGCGVSAKGGLVYGLWRIRTVCRRAVVLNPVDLEDLELVDTSLPRVAVAGAASDVLRQHPNVVALLKGFRHRLGVAGEL